MPDQPTGRLARTQATTRSVVLDLLSALILLGSIGAAVAALVLPVNQLTQPGGATRVELSGQAQEQAADAITGLPAGSWLEFLPDLYSMSLHVFELSWPLRLLTEAGTSLLLACLAGSGLLLFRTLRTIRLGAPFDPANPYRLRLIGLLVLVGGLGGQALDAVARFALLDAAGPVTPDPILTSATLDLTWAVTGLVALALAEAFAVGRRLTDDVTGLI
ncbi:hypothetical protein GCM10023168_19230 [Fodinibacter luteus]|uniref:DUF2975 domain-containing protein n=1 Tax=Fodinibacter luteus TaxID=552064 RepID=A0ABP8KEQ2_9MICO